MNRIDAFNARMVVRVRRDVRPSIARFAVAFTFGMLLVGACWR